MSSFKDDNFCLTDASENISTCFKFLECVIQRPLVLPSTCTLDLKKLSFKKIVAKYQWEFDEEVLPYLKVKLNVVQHQNNGHVILLYDNRYYKSVKSDWPEICVILDKKEHILKRGNFSVCIPFSTKSSVFNLPPEKPLWELLNVDCKLKNPTNYKELMKVIKKYQLLENSCVSYFWKITDVNCRFGEIWIHPARAFYNVDIEAFLKPNYTLGFRNNTNFLDNLKMDQIESRRKKINVEKKSVEVEPLNEFQKNNSTSVSVRLTGLNEIYNISCIHLEDWKKISKSYGETISVLWVDLDNLNQARCVTYKDKFLQQHIELANQKDWTFLFDLILKQREKMMEEKKQILSSCLEYLEPLVTKDGDSFKRCLASLTSSIQTSNVLVYGLEDHVMHALKLQFAFYMKNRKPKGFRGIRLIPDPKNSLVMLKTAEIVFCNFISYSELEKNESSICKDPPVLSNNIKSLHNQPPQPNGFSTKSYVVRRGIEYSDQLFLAWQSFGQNFMSNFQFDIFSLPFISLPTLSYTAIWSSYTKKGSTFHHGVEKTKPFDQNLLRQHCKGGFSYSRQLRREENEKLKDNEEQVCKNIQSYDVRSCYGYSASELSSIKGFQYSFKLTDNDKLVRCDFVSRFKTFEFLAVFFTLHYVETVLKISIRTVYSNFSQNGIFWIGSYPVDLAVVTNEGKLLLWNFDGIYFHGCSKTCPDLPSYVHNKSKETLRLETEKRDNFIQRWIHTRNQNMSNTFFLNDYCTYKVISDCHHPMYQKNNLLKVYRETPKLLPLISDYIEKKVIDYNDVIYSNENVTFLALIEGFCPTPDMHPLLVRHSETRIWSRSNSTLQEKVLLSRDHLNWLRKEFNFQVTKIHKVWFYKKCPLFNSIFKDLIVQRASCTSPSQNHFYKSVVNMCTGYLGKNELKSQTFSTIRLVTHLSKTAETYDTEIIQAGWVENTEFLIVKKHFVKSKIIANRNACLPLYCFVTDFGRMRLSQCFCFFEMCLESDKYLFVYSHIDNLTLILSTESLEEAVKTVMKSKFIQQQSHYFGPSPGQLKKEFEFLSGDGWRYVTAKTQNYAVLALDAEKNLHKNNGLNNISSDFSYQAALKILKKQKVSIVQTRRVDKMCNTDTISKTLCYTSHI